jgi:2-oxoglutarate dehydrogenase E1 component
LSTPPSTPPFILPPQVNGLDPAFLDSLYQQWKKSPTAVPADWQTFFQGFELGFERAPEPPRADGPAASTSTAPPEVAPPLAAHATGPRGSQSKVDSLIYAYRNLGHLAADLDPLGGERPFPEQLTLESFGLTDADLEATFDPGSLPLPNPAPLSEIVSLLEETYCGHIGVEYEHVQHRDKRRWLQQRMESVRNKPAFDATVRKRLLDRLVAAEGFESFLEKRYIGKKRFGLEGGESLIAILDTLVEQAPANGIREFALGMAHRGRLNVLANVLHKKFDQIFTEFEEAWTEDFVEGGGDVKYHQGYSGDVTTTTGQSIHLTLAANPSHLEFVTAVVMGRCRAKQRMHHDTEQRKAVVPVVMHGDAAFPGQGVVAECLNMALLDGYTVGGTVHIIVNNQVGFTTNQRDLFSGTYCTEIAKMVDAPIFHVNGDDPEACAWAARLALEWRQSFGTDVVIDLWCFRKNGHNETDEPAFTQPLMYQRIRSHPGVMRLYAQRLEQEGVVTKADIDAMHAELHQRMDEAQTRTRGQPVDPSPDPFKQAWAGLREDYSDAPVETGVPEKSLRAIAARLSHLPDGFTPHKNIARLLKSRAELGATAGVDWALGELLAFGSLLLEGHPIRLTGQDVERGTFSHRHVVVNCQERGTPHVALNDLGGEQARFCVHNSPLTEQAVVGYEYGYSLTDPRMLIIWEAQFGDFGNGAQVIIDQFIASAETKWQRFSGLVLQLPHGYEGQGPEHSSARLERFLQLCAGDNMVVCQPTTAAQLFHLLRRQMKVNFRKPLVLMTPKSMLRLPAACSPLKDFTTGCWQRVLADEAAPPPESARRLLLCSGKLFHELAAQRAKAAAGDVAIARVEQLHPFPVDEIQAQLDRFAKAEVVWVQEEPRNMGAWRHVQANFMDHFASRAIRYIGRGDAASPAVGSQKMHQHEQDRILVEAVGAARSETVAGKAAAATKH